MANRRRLRNPDDPITSIEAHFPKHTMAVLKSYSENHAIPISQLIMRAVDNELDQPEPFKYSVEFPEVTFVEGQYIDEARRIYEFLKTRETGFDRETLMASRRMMNLEDKTLFLLGLRELLNQKMLVEEYRPTKVLFAYDKNYRRIRVVPYDKRAKIANQIYSGVKE